MKSTATHLLVVAAGLLSAGLGSCNSSSDASPASAERAADNGKGGSLARFTVLGDNLYVVDNSNLRLFSLARPEAPAAGAVVPLIPGVETIYPRAPYLFLGTQRGMYIFDASTPAAPTQLAYYQHVVSCDPVVVDNRFAYVTLRDGRTCGTAGNQLQVIDLQDLRNPRLAQSYPMQGPMGLGVDSAMLFVCDRNQLKVYNTAAAPTLPAPRTFDVNVFDVIPHRGLLLAIGPNGLYQYRYRNGQLIPLSLLPIKPTK